MVAGLFAKHHTTRKTYTCKYSQEHPKSCVTCISCCRRRGIHAGSCYFAANHTYTIYICMTKWLIFFVCFKKYITSLAANFTFPAGLCTGCRNMVMFYTSVTKCRDYYRCCNFILSLCIAIILLAGFTVPICLGTGFGTGRLNLSKCSQLVTCCRNC